MKCNICNSINNLVSDHNHATGRIRGLLCQLCNSWLGVYESNLRKKKRNGRGKYKQWVLKYESRIENHLQTITDSFYKKRFYKG